MEAPQVLHSSLTPTGQYCQYRAKQEVHEHKDKA